MPKGLAPIGERSPGYLPDNLNDEELEKAIVEIRYRYDRSIANFNTYDAALYKEILVELIKDKKKREVALSC